MGQPRAATVNARQHGKARRLTDVGSTPPSPYRSEHFRVHRFIAAVRHSGQTSSRADLQQPIIASDCLL